MIEKKIVHTWTLLRYTFGCLFIVVGIDKFFDTICCWQKYISPLLLAAIPVSSISVMQLFGIAQIIAGFLVLTRWALYGIMGELLLLIAIFFDLLAMQNQFVVIVHDITLIIFLLVLYSLNTIVLDLRTSDYV